MSARIDALAAALQDRLGPKAAALAAGVLLDMMKAGYCVLHVSTELPGELRDGGLLVRMAAELEASATQAATYGAMTHAKTVGRLARADSRPADVR